MISTTKRKIAQLLDPAEFTIRPLSDDPKYQAAKAELDALQNRFTQAEKRFNRALARQRAAPKSGRNIVELATNLLAGGTIAGIDPAAEMKAAQEEQEILRAAISAAFEKLTEVVGEASFKICRSFVGDHHHYLLELLAGLEATSNALECLATLDARIGAAGYTVRSDILPAAIPVAAYAIGSASVWDSALATFKRWLVSQGIR